ncbi:DUF1801 domain-containing protein [Cyclobacteriaceae bacterium]|nr:DUF1801 domain-containing protein [Cyclobacteriaceae bacterium]
MDAKRVTISAYIKKITPDKQHVVSKIRQIIVNNLPQGFEEEINYGMIGYIVPHSLFPEGYHFSPKNLFPS